MSLKMSYYLYLFFIVAVSGKNLNSQEKRIFFLKCLFKDKNEPCDLLTDDSFSRNVSLLSPQVVREIYKLDGDVIHAIHQHNFTTLDEKSLLSVPAGIMIFLPICHLALVDRGIMKSLLTLWNKDEIVFKHLVNAILHSKNLDLLSEKLQEYDISDEHLMWIAEVTFSSKLPEVRRLTGKLPLIFYSPPESIILNNKYEKFYLLSSNNKPADFISVCSNRCLLRFWAYIMFKNDFPEPLEDWSYLYTQRWGYVLTGASTNELSRLSENSFSELDELFNLNLSTIQIRLLYDQFHGGKKLYKEKYSNMPQAVKNLLPLQLIELTCDADFVNLTLSSYQSLTSAIQILEMMAVKYTEVLNLKDIKYPYTQFSYALPLEIFESQTNNALSIADILKMQSKLLSKSQLYFISRNRKVFNFSSEDIFNYNEILKVVPSSKILYDRFASNILLHLLSHVDGYNIPQVFAVLNKIWPEIGSEIVLKHISYNDHSSRILEFLPTRFILEHPDNLIQLIQSGHFGDLPPVLVTTISRKMKELETNFQPFYFNESYSFLHHGLTCEDILLLDPYYFTYTMSQFNRYRKLSGKIFPKRLQLCCINKLVELLQLKSFLDRQPPGESKLSLLNEEEINAIGGYIFSVLPSDAIKKMRNSKVIIKSIGLLSSYELLSATSLKQLNKLSSILAEDVYCNEEQSFPLFNMGNLTLFLEKEHIKRINREYFKLFLESGYIDNRLCADQETRSAWFKFLTHAFGETSTWTYETLVTLGDFLIVVPLNKLDEIKDQAWIYSADVLRTKYFDTYERESDKKFYEVCLLRLPQEEQNIYLGDLKKLVTTLVHAAQLQLNTIVPAYKLAENRETNNTETVFRFIDTDKNIKVLIPSIKQEIGNYSTPSLHTFSMPVRLQTPQTENTSYTFTSTRTISVAYSVTVPINSISADSDESKVSIEDHSTTYLPAGSELAYSTGQPSRLSEEPQSLDYKTTQTESVLFKSDARGSIRDFYENYTSTNPSVTEHAVTEASSNIISTSEQVLDNSKTPSSSDHQPTQENITSSNVMENYETKYQQDCCESTVSSKSIESHQNFSLFSSTSFSPMKYNNLVDKLITPIETNTDIIKQDTTLVPTIFSYIEDERTNKKKVNETTIVSRGTSNTINALFNLTFYSNEPTSTMAFVQMSTENSMENSTEYLNSRIIESISTVSNVQMENISPSANNERSTENVTRPSPQNTSIVLNSYNVSEISFIEFPSNKFYSPDNNSMDKINKYTPEAGIFTYNSPDMQITSSLMGENNNKDILSKSNKLSGFQNNQTENISINSATKTLSEYHDSIQVRNNTNPSPSLKEININPNISGLLNMNNMKYHTQFLGDNSNKRVINTSKKYSVLNNRKLEVGVPETAINETNLKIKKIILKKRIASKKYIAEIRPKDKKRSIQKWSCNAFRMVGKPTEIILDENIVSSLDDTDIYNCIDLFAELDLSIRAKMLIWKRVQLENIVISGKLVSAANVPDLMSSKFSLYDSYALEKIYLLGQYNTNDDVRQYVVNKVWENTTKPLPVEMIVSLGSLVCELPQISTDVIKPEALFKASPILGKSLPCNSSCLSKLASIIVRQDAYKDPTKWTYSDVHDLGILVAGLNMNGWKKLMQKNQEALQGLSDAAFDCLPYKYIKMIKEVDQSLLPVKISNKLDQEVHNENEFDFFENSVFQETHHVSTACKSLFSTLYLIALFLAIVVL